MKKIVVLTGAGISAESGLRTFRDMNGLWEEYDIQDVASYDGWLRNPGLVLEFYNQRRRQLAGAEPNEGHKALVLLEQKFDVHIVTQNVDDLHERAGSTKVMHLHGELTKVRSTADPNLVYTLDGWELKWGDLCEKGSQLRPHIVWFGEAVPMIYPAQELASEAGIFIVIGTSLNVYPAAGLLYYVKPSVPIYLIDPNAAAMPQFANLTVLHENAGTGVPRLVEKLLQES